MLVERLNVALNHVCCLVSSHSDFTVGALCGGTRWVSAAALAKHGLLTSVKNLSLCNLDTAAVAELGVLESRVTDRVELNGVCGDLGPVLAGLRCDLLALD